VYNAADGEEGYAFMRNASTLQPYAHNAQPTLLLRRGYTGHEHLPEFGLINMNARLYDPITGRMLSPDPYIMDPAYSQDYNRYTYVRNNPLIYTDPSGESFKDWWRKIFGGKTNGNTKPDKPEPNKKKTYICAKLYPIGIFADNLLEFYKYKVAHQKFEPDCFSQSFSTEVFGKRNAHIKQDNLK